ncbi:MAG: hypothetical protein AAGG06_03290 [Pseudomonadota bacterium]
MTRTPVAALILTALALAAGLLVEIRSDMAAVFGEDAAAVTAPRAREILVAVRSDEPAARHAAARAVADAMRADPLLHELSTGPAPPDRALRDWFWRHRFRLAPPAPSDVTPGALAARLTEARARLTTMAGMAVGDAMLRDPTGSFSRLLQRLESAQPDLPVEEGLWHTPGGPAALIRGVLAPGTQDLAAIRALTDRLRSAAADAGARAIILGPQVVSAAVSHRAETMSAMVGGVATALLLAWLGWATGSLAGLTRILLPLAIGIGAATLAVQGLFGSVHVIALGFGGALTGLALDYPLHLMTHRGAGQARARRLILIGAATTAIAFLALSGSSLDALAQTGVFVATGLLAAGLAARSLLAGSEGTLRRLPFPHRLTLPRQPWWEGGLIALGVVALMSSAAPSAERLYTLPAQTEADLAEIKELVDLPSGRFHVVVTGSDAEVVLRTERALLPIIDAQIRAGQLVSARHLGAILPDVAEQEARRAALPSAAAYGRNAAEALAAAGLATEFQDALVAAYREALAAPPVVPADFAAWDGLSDLAASLEETGGGWQSVIPLLGLTGPDALSRAIRDAQIPGAVLVDLSASVNARLAALRETAITWLGIGGAGAFVVLLLLAGDWRRALAIARSTAAALAVTAMALLALGIPLGIFQILALTLVVGIGIDYGLFLRLSADRAAAVSSVGLCATSTLIAFVVMAFAPISPLHEIGLTVSLGVCAMLGLHLAAQDAQTP